MDKPKKIAALVILGALVVASILVVILNANNTSDSAGQPVQDAAARTTTPPSITYPQCADFLDNYFIGSPPAKANEVTGYGWTFRLWDDVGNTSWATGEPWEIGGVERDASTCSVRFKVVSDQPVPGAAAPVKPSYDGFIGALILIDPDIVHGKSEKAISRGRNQCDSVRSTPNDQAKLVDLANTRFTSPNHPNGFGLAKAERILDAVRTHLCPTP